MNDGGWEVFSFVSKTKNRWCVDNRNLFDFFELLWQEKNLISGQRYILGIQAGNEIMEGAGTYTFEEFSLLVNG